MIECRQLTIELEQLEDRLKLKKNKNIDKDEDCSKLERLNENFVQENEKLVHKRNNLTLTIQNLDEKINETALILAKEKNEEQNVL